MTSELTTALLMSVSELLEGESLRSVLREGGLTARKAIDHAVQIAQGMAAAHEKGIVHRDLKPENLFLTRDGRVKILDFGLAKLRDPVGLQAAPETGTATWTTASGTVLGTVGYMSPEQVRGVPADHRSDIFSFGAVLYEMLARRRAFHRETAAETLTAILKEDPADLDGTDAQITPGLQRILRRCLEKRPEDRFQSARDLAFALGSLSGSSPRSEASALQGPAAVASRRGWVLALATVVALAGLGAGLWRLGRADAVWENPLSGARFTRFTDFEGSEVDASLSSDGKFVVFLSDRAGPFDAWVSQVGSGEFVNLTNGRFPQLFNEAVRNVGFSEDGAHVWIQVVGKTPTDHSVWLIPTMGGSPRPLLPTAVSVAWSPDGTRLAYHEAGPGDPVFLADRDGGNPRRLFVDELGTHWHHPAWSRDGRYLFFCRGFPRDELDIWRLPVAGGEPERLTHDDSRLEYPTPLDDDTVLYVAPGQDAGGSELHALDLRRRVTHRLTFGLEEYLSIAASADGHRLVATVANPSRSLWTVPISERVADESAATRLAVPFVRADRPRFGPDYLLLVSAKGGADGLWRWREGELTELWKAREGRVVAAPAVSPDGQWVCLNVYTRGRTRLHVMAADGTGVRTLAETLDARTTPSWSPDGKWIAVAAVEGKKVPLFKVPVDGGLPVRLAEGVTRCPVWSPDGALIVYSESVRGAFDSLRAVKSDGVPVPLPDVLVLWSGDRYRFLPGGKQLVVMQGPFRRQDFQLLDIATGRMRPLTQLKPGYDITSFDISRDGRQIAFDRVRENADIVLIDR